MHFGANFTAYDLVIFALFALLVGRGIWLGFIKQVTGLLALYIGYLAASQYNDRLFPFLRGLSNNPKVVFIADYVLMFCLTYVVVMLLGKGLSYVIQFTVTGWFDRVLGAVLGFAKALILVVLLHMILGTLLAPENPMLRDCATCSTLNSAVDFTRELIRNKETRDALKQNKPAISLEAVKSFIKSHSPSSTEEPRKK